MPRLVWPCSVPSPVFRLRFYLACCDPDSTQPRRSTRSSARLVAAAVAAHCATRSRRRSETPPWSSPTGCQTRALTWTPTVGRCGSIRHRRERSPQRSSMTAGGWLRSSTTPASQTSSSLCRQSASRPRSPWKNERLDAELRASVAELRASRARIVQAGDEQRRRIERDLHDGAQQRLMALGINLRLLRDQIKRDPQDAIELLDASLQELSEATGELRELARGIHPAVLNDRGLQAALNALARRSPVLVEVVETPCDRLPPSIESAVYFVVAEALTNAARYATAQSVTVSVVRRHAQVEIDVTDDGVGGADPEQGSGLRGLHDRIAALDGHLQLASEATKRTTLRARIPCG